MNDGSSESGLETRPSYESRDTVVVGQVRATGVAELSNNKHLTDVQKYSRASPVCARETERRGGGGAPNAARQAALNRLPADSQRTPSELSAESARRFQAALEYDDALASPDAEKADKLARPRRASLSLSLSLERLRAQAAALWRSVWLATEEVSVEHCEELARYTQAQLEMLRSCSLPDLLENKFEWAVPKFTLPPASTPKQP